MVLLSASVERFSVSCMQDFCLCFQRFWTYIFGYFKYCLVEYNNSWESGRNVCFNKKNIFLCNIKNTVTPYFRMLSIFRDFGLELPCLNLGQLWNRQVGTLPRLLNAILYPWPLNFSPRLKDSSISRFDQISLCSESRSHQGPGCLVFFGTNESV